MKTIQNVWEIYESVTKILVIFREIIREERAIPALFPAKFAKMIPEIPGWVVLQPMSGISSVLSLAI